MTLFIFSVSILANFFCFSMPMASAARPTSQTMASTSVCQSDDNHQHSDFNLQSDPGRAGMPDCCLAKSNYFQSLNQVDSFKFFIINPVAVNFENIRLDNDNYVHLYHLDVLPPPQLAAVRTIVKRE